MKHINRDELFSSLPVRVAFLKDMVNFGSEDIAALSASRKLIDAAVPAVVDKVYAKLLEYDVTARVFTSRDTRSTQDPEEWPTMSSKEICRRKIFLRWYFKKLTSSPVDAKYWEYLDKVASMHAGNHRYAPMRVEYLFLGACLGYIHTILLEAVFSIQELAVKHRLATAQALGKILWIQNDLFAKWQLQDCDACRKSKGATTDSVTANGSETCSFLMDSGDDELDPIDYEISAMVRPRTQERGNNGSTCSSPNLNPYTMIRVWQANDNLRKLEPESRVQKIIKSMDVAHSEQLHDGSLELLLEQNQLPNLQDELDRSSKLIHVERDYDPWQPTKEAEDYFGPEPAKELYRDWTMARARRLASLPSDVGNFYQGLIEKL